MAICYARLEFVKRSEGKNAVAKAAYNSRSRIEFSGNKIMDEKVYNWSYLEKPAHHNILIPSHASDYFLNTQNLWNTVEQSEKKINAVVSNEIVLALPDDNIISLEDKIKLTESFVREHFILKGFAAQVDIHSPENAVEGDSEKMNKNWHAHIQITTRRFLEDGKTFEKNKPREYTTALRGGRVISGPDWGKLWAEHQNNYFEEKGLSLRVDPTGIVPQEHLGPVRMRGRALSLMEKSQLLKTMNQIESIEAKNILKKITETKNIFSVQDVDQYLCKYVEPKLMESVKKDFWSLPNVVSLMDHKELKPLNKFTSQEVIDEESKIQRISQQIVSQSAFQIKKAKSIGEFSQNLNNEQKIAYNNIINGKRLSCIEGHAGTGKSHLLVSLKNLYEAQGYKVRAFGPDNATAAVLREKGFEYSENIYKFNFSVYFEKSKIEKGNEVWILDEAGKLGNRPLLEFLKFAEKNNAQVIFSGCTSQIASVDRGGMFGYFCQKFGFQSLVNIQRQKLESHKMVSRKLANGDISGAIDQIVSNGGFKWSTTKTEAMESIIKTWAIEQSHFPLGSFAIIAHTNGEIKALNELARSYLKQTGQISGEEFECETAFGNVFFSVGDKIEFRKNDGELNVTNGTDGTLVKITPNEMTVRVDEKDTSRFVSFDPKKYNNFQLGYATTNFRSQGATVDRAYVLHSPYLNREMFYVGLTRHVKNVQYFVSREDAFCLSELKRQAFRSNPRKTTLEYVTQDQIDKSEYQKAWKEEIEKLQQSESIGSKLKGYSLGAVDAIGSKIGQFVQKYQDRKPNRDFFNPKIKETSQKNSGIKKVSNLEIVDSLDIKTESKNIIRPSINETAPSSTSKATQSKQISPYNTLDDHKKKLVNEYYQSVDKASVLRSIVKTESESLNQIEKLTPHYSEWQKACVERNEKAYQVYQGLSDKEERQIFKKASHNILVDQASKYEYFSQKDKTKNIDLEKGLKEQLEPLLVRLFPEGASSQDRCGLRFGSKGSLRVVCSGEKRGVFFDYENGEGGGLLKLVQKKMGLDYNESKNWAMKFLGESHDIPDQVKMTFTKFSKAEEEWISAKPKLEQSAPSLSQISSYLNKEYTEKGRYAYKDLDGNVLFYTLRLVSNNDPSKKIVPPLSYGHYKYQDNYRWSLKAFRSSDVPLYGLHLLKEKPEARVMIVEGEKTADAANKLFVNDNIIALSWMGGSSRVSKADWAPIFGRDVIIWPDNDKPGYKASNEVCTELKKVGVKSLEVVDQDVLSTKFPEKWDLADPLPEGFNMEAVRNLLINGKERGVPFAKFANSIGITEQSSESDKLIARDVLYLVDERLRPSLEDKFKSSPWEVRNTIIGEVSNIIKGQVEVESSLINKFGFSKEIARQIAMQQMYYQSSQGKSLSEDNIHEIKKMLSSKEIFSVFETHALDKEFKDYIKDKSLFYLIESGASLEQSKSKAMLVLENGLNSESKMIATAKNMDKERGRGLSI